MSNQFQLPFESPERLRVQVLGSSSAGNCTLVWDGEDAVLVDVGFGSRYLSGALRSVGLSFAALSGVLVTHTHGDHVHDDAVLRLVEFGVPILCPASIRPHLLRNYPAVTVAMRRGLLRPIRESTTSIGSIGITAFDVPHDSPGGCYGYSLTKDGTKVTVATDIGFPRDSIVEHFANSTTIVIESNHDPDMLENSKRPEWLKRRIRERGHLSNGECAGLVTSILKASDVAPLAVVLAHISQECNTNPLAVATTADALGREGGSGIPVIETFKDQPSSLVC